MRSTLLFFLTYLTLWAHPHVFIDVYPTVGPERLTLRWVFDEMNSNMLLMDFDTDRDGALSDGESEVLRTEIFNNFAEYGYYTYFFDGTGELKTGKASDFSAAVEKDRLVFAFTLPRPAAARSVRFYDPDNWTGYRVTDAFVSEANPGKQYTLRQHEFDYVYGYILELP